ncbi:MAG TPA: efflux transporter outer membrane subunit, partial [Gemmataceae bacterium]|nr:efflux transporter outer membrane subunit [Gemmataceae bacterium]
TRSVFSTATGQGLRGTGQRYITQWDLGFNLTWELDFWGRLRRAVDSADDTLEASMFDYDAILVTLLSDVATAYVNIRVAEKRIQYARANSELQRKTVAVVENRFKAGVAKQVDLAQAQALMYQTEATIYDLEISARQNANLLCILLGMPPEDLQPKLGKAQIPTPPQDVIVGVPADLVRQRPDVRRAERAAAAQSEQIGIAEAEWYPHVFINGQIFRSASYFHNLWRPEAYNGNILPNFQWNILSYGRTLNNVRLQDAKFQELVFAYQQTVLNGQQEAENGLITFLNGQKRFQAQSKSVAAAETAEKLVLAQFEAGTVSIPQLILFEQNLVQQQDTLALAQGEFALGLIQVYKALGGGWQIRRDGCPPPQQAFPLAPQEQKFLPPIPEPLPQMPTEKKTALLGPPS